MRTRTFHIAVMALLVLNLSGASAFSFSADCGMECCRPADWDGTSSYEAPSCCGMDGVTCGFETGRLEEFLETALCRSASSYSSNQHHNSIPAIAGISSSTHIRTYALALNFTGSPPATPVFLSNAAILC